MDKMKYMIKRNPAGLNSDFFFSYIGCLTKARNLSLLYNLPIVREEMYTCLSQEHAMKGNSSVQD